MSSSSHRHNHHRRGGAGVGVIDERAETTTPNGTSSSPSPSPTGRRRRRRRFPSSISSTFRRFRLRFRSAALRFGPSGAVSRFRTLTPPRRRVLVVVVVGLSLVVWAPLAARRVFSESGGVGGGGGDSERELIDVLTFEAGRAPPPSSSSGGIGLSSRDLYPVDLPPSSVGSPPDRRPPPFLGRCVTRRPSNFDEEDSGGLGDGDDGRRRRKVGLAFVEEPSHFVSLSTKTNSFHLFHFLEFLIVGYAELRRQSSSSSGGDEKTLPSEEAIVDVPWLYVPHLTREEICGVRGINCLVADVLFARGRKNHAIGIHGLESNDPYVSDLDPMFVGDFPPQQWWTRWLPWGRRRRKTLPRVPIPPVQRILNARSMTMAADGVVMIDRAECDHGGINKLWAKYLDEGSFPADEWHKDVSAGLASFDGKKVPVVVDDDGAEEGKDETKRRKIVVSYVDRQNTNRKMHPSDHDWLIRTLSSRADILFRRLRMERLSGIEQLRVGHDTDVMIGVHGNGLTHQLWMKPRGTVIEIYWKFPFQFDYATASMLMKHEYLAVFNGRVLDGKRVRGLDESLMRMDPSKVGRDGGRFAEETRAAVVETIDDAVERKNDGVAPMTNE